MIFIYIFLITFYQFSYAKACAPLPIKSQSDLIEKLKADGIIKSSRVEQIMRAVDRKNYVTSDFYKDSAQTIGLDSKISAPYMHATELEILNNFIKVGDKVLDVGSGSGYLTACMALMVGETGFVVGIDLNPELIEISTSNIKHDQPNLIKKGRIKLIVDDGRKGYSKLAPYNVIHVGAAATNIPPALIKQLQEGGRMLIPINLPDGKQSLTQIDKLQNGTIIKRPLINVKVLPLIEKKEYSVSGSFKVSYNYSYLLILAYICKIF